MVSKKKRKKTMKRKSKSNSSLSQHPNRQNSSNAFLPVITSLPQDEWVTLNMKLLDWNYMDFQITVNVNTNLHTIHKILYSKHGRRIKDLVLYRDAIVKEENEMCDEMKSLSDYGLSGGLIKDKAPNYSICYDFKPMNDCNDPVLLSWMA